VPKIAGLPNTADKNAIRKGGGNEQRLLQKGSHCYFDYRATGVTGKRLRAAEGL
jgi:hypothetical protein